MRRFLKRLGAVVGVVVLAVVAAELWGRHRLGAARAESQELIASERQRLAAVRHPVLVGQPLEGNAADTHKALLERLRTAMAEAPDRGTVYRQTLQKAAAAGPAVAVDPGAAAILDRHRGEVAELREALRGERCDWHYPMEEGYRAPIPSLLAARVLGHLLVVDGHRLAQSGDAAGGSLRYLEAVRFGVDFGDEPLLISSLMGIALSGNGLENLGALVVSDLPGVPLSEIDGHLTRLEPVLPGVAVGFRGERIAMGSLADVAPTDVMDSPPQGASRVLLGLVPWRAISAHALAEMTPMFQEMERGATSLGAKEWESLAQSVSERAQASWNPITRIAMPSLARARVSADDLRARMALVRTAIRLEQRRASEGRYPEILGELSSPDPHAMPPGALRYAVAEDGRSYRLWSVGPDHTDDGGQATALKDILLERKVRSAPSP